MKPPCTLVGAGGNGVEMLLLVNRVLHEAGLKEQADEFLKRATTCSIYNNQIVRLAREYVEIE
jgi:hypothetical protein